MRFRVSGKTWESIGPNVSTMLAELNVAMVQRSKCGRGWRFTLEGDVGEMAELAHHLEDLGQLLCTIDDAEDRALGRALLRDARRLRAELSDAVREQLEAWR